MASSLIDGKFPIHKYGSNIMSSSSSISSRSRQISRASSLKIHHKHGKRQRLLERTPSMPTTSVTPQFPDNHFTTEYVHKSYSWYEEPEPNDSYLIPTPHHSHRDHRFLKHAISAPPSSFWYYMDSISRYVPSKLQIPSVEEGSKDIPTSIRVNETINETSPLLIDQRLARSSKTLPKVNCVGQRKFACFGHAKRFADEDLHLSRIAMAFLLDFQDSRAPTLPGANVTMTHLFVHWLRFSIFWQILMGASTVSLFIASIYESGRNKPMLALFTFIPVFIFAADMLMMGYLFGRNSIANDCPRGKSPRLHFYGTSHGGGAVQAFLSTASMAPVEARKSRSRWWALPLTAFLFALSIETIVVLSSNSSNMTTPRRMLMISVCKPVAIFYTSPKARNALDAMNLVVRIVFKVIFIELFVIFTFAAVACQLYGEEFTPFGNLQKSFLTMLEISTLVATPSPWMPIYNRWHSSAIFFVFFLVVCVFYLHSLVLSVVFQSYMEGLMIIREHGAHDKEENLRLAFQTLYQVKGHGGQNETSVEEPVRITTKSIKKVLLLMRPQYTMQKIDTLVDIVDPTHHGAVDYNSFRTRVPKAMATTVKTLRSYNTFSHMMYAFAVFLAMLNFCYTILASSPYNSFWWEKIVFPTGGTVTVLSIIELLIRLLPFCKYRIPEAAKPNIAFDGLAILAAVVSTIGIIMCYYRYDKSLDWMITGRALDLARCIRLAKEARGIVKRSGRIFPYVVGPMALVFAALHVFTYAGQAIWGGKIQVGNNPNLTPYYDLNNFNSYQCGIMTMFQMLVANDWHLLAEVFILPTPTATNKFVYPFFIISILVMVNVLLNVLTAFFVGAFITKTSGKSSRTSEANHCRRQMQILDNASNVGSNRVEQFSNKSDISKSFEPSNAITVSERPGFDTMMRNIAGMTEDEDAVATICCHLLELFEHLAVDGNQNQQIGYLVSCHYSMSRYGNQRFQDIVHSYMNDDAVHKIISEMQEELSRSSHGHEIVVSRSFSAPLCENDQSTQPTLELTASMLKEGSSVALFLAKFI